VLTLSQQKILDDSETPSVEPLNLGFTRWKSEVISRENRTSNGIGSGEARSWAHQSTRDGKERVEQDRGLELAKMEDSDHLSHSPHFYLV